jgi:hypothetical protein|nr:MAG TPA: hypothetical protein [Caudoviricetes sp.]
MKEQEFIIDEVKKHLQASARKDKYQVIDAVEEMPTFEEFIFSYYSQRLDGTQFPVNVEEMYIYCDEWEEFYNETIIKVAQAILEAEQIKEA